ncbi:hypothetical protein Tco_0807427, partial [Tanacetum coccineum]
MAESLCNKFKGGKYRVMLVKDTWLGNALSLRGQGTQHGLSKRQCLLKHKNLPKINHDVAFQTDDLDSNDSNCNDISSAKAVLMVNLSNYGQWFSL